MACLAGAAEMHMPLGQPPGLPGPLRLALMQAMQQQRHAPAMLQQHSQAMQHSQPMHHHPHQQQLHHSQQQQHQPQQQQHSQAMHRPQGGMPSLPLPPTMSMAALAGLPGRSGEVRGRPSPPLQASYGFALAHVDNSCGPCSMPAPRTPFLLAVQPATLRACLHGHSFCCLLQFFSLTYCLGEVVLLFFSSKHVWFDVPLSPSLYSAMLLHPTGCLTLLLECR